MSPKRLLHRLGFHPWLAFPESTSDEHCPVCGSRREAIDVDDSPWGVRTRSRRWVITVRAWEKDIVL